MKDVLLIAHRGLFDNINIIENTIPAFEKCINQKIPFELDVQLTLDNKIVVFHDDNLKRMSNQNTIIQNSNYYELKDILLLKKGKIPLLSEVLEINQDKVFIDIEIKNTKRIQDTVFYLMSELKNYHNYSIKSFNPKIIHFIKKHYPFVQCGLLIHHHYNSKFYNFLYKTPFMILFSKADFLSIHKALIHTKKYLKLSKKYPIQVWTINNNSEIDNPNISYVCNKLPYKKNKS